MAADDKFLIPGKRYVTMVMHADTGEPLAIAPGRDKNDFKHFFSRFKAEGKKKTSSRVSTVKRIQGGNRQAEAAPYRVLGVLSLRD